MTVKEASFQTPCGDIHYWADIVDSNIITLVLLPGLTADHRLFDKQVEHFKGRYNILLWDPPAHGASWPFTFNFDMADKARWLEGILKAEGIARPVIVGQSMGGYVGQMYAQLYPERLKGFISIDSAPLQRHYITWAELWLLKRMEPVYNFYPWKWLLSSGTKGVAVTSYVRELMKAMMLTYAVDKKRYAKIAGHGFKILAEAIEKDLPYKLPCPSLLICGDKDKAGSAKRYNRLWHEKEGIPIEWIKNAGHNSNTDRPEVINSLIETLVQEVL